MTEVFHHPLSLPPAHLGLYVHIPFCVRKCRYCDFASRPLDEDRQLPEAYIDALRRESDSRRCDEPHPLHSIYIGGGTPTTLTGAQLRRLWHEVIAPFPRLPEAEITIEANPGTLTDDVLSALHDLPITRVSLGAQSLDAAELAMLGRIHSPAAVATGVTAVRAAGIPQVNLDLIYALPGQTAEHWAHTLRQAVALQPEHLSCYALIIEEETPLSQQVAAGILPEPSEEEEEKMLAVTTELLSGAGYSLYEVSNAARPGAHSRHNLGYWLGRDYLGLGAAATSAYGALRWRNCRDATTYVTRLAAGQPVIEYVERLSAGERLLERVMLGLRLCAGFDLAAAEAACGCSLAAIAGTAVAALETENLLAREGDLLRLTSTGFPLANQVVSRLMLAREAHSRAY